MKQREHREIEYKTINYMLDQVISTKSQMLNISLGPVGYIESYIQQGYGVTIIELTEMEKEWQQIQLSQFKSEYFDVVLCIDVLEHLHTEEARKHCIKECLKVLKDKGTLILSYKCKWSILPFALAREEGVSIEAYLRDLETEKYPTPERMEYLLDDCQCRILGHIGLDGIVPLVHTQIEKLKEKDYQDYMTYHLKVCSERSILGMSHKSLLVAKKEESFTLCKNFDKTQPIQSLIGWKNQITRHQQMKWGAGEPLYDFAAKWLEEDGVWMKASIQKARHYQNLNLGVASPEYETIVEELKRAYTHGLAVCGSGDSHEIFISIDIRGDEPFGYHTTKEYYKEARGKMLIGQKNDVEERIVFLSGYLSGNKNKLQMLDLRYELAEALVSTLIEAERKSCQEAIFIVQEMKKDQLNSMKQARNLQDINSMIHFIDKQGKNLNIGEITGPLYVSGSRIPLYIGYL